MSNPLLRTLISEMIQLHMHEGKVKHDFKNPDFHSVDYDADKASDLTRPHEKNIEILNKQAKHHTSNFNSDHPNSHRFLHQSASDAAWHAEEHLKTLRKKGVWNTHDFRGTNATHKAAEYKSHLDDFHHNPDKFEKSIKKIDDDDYIAGHYYSR